MVASPSAMRALPLSPSASLALLLALDSLACKRVGADVSTSEAPAEKKPTKGEHTQQNDPSPTYVLLPWGTELFSAPTFDAYAMTLIDPGEGSGRVVAVIAREGDWWTIETVDQATAETFGVEPIEGLDFYRLQLHVPAGTGWPLKPIPPGPDTPASAALHGPAASPSSEESAALDVARQQALESGIVSILSVDASFGDPPLQSGYRPPGATVDWRVSPSAKVYWPDGRSAGEVRTEHAFAYPGVPAANDELLCFEVRIGLAEDYAGQLCFARADVREAEVLLDGNVWGGITGTSIEDAFDVEGLGLVGTGQGGGGSSEGTMGMGTIGRGGDGGTGSGYGIGGLGSPITSVKLGEPTVTGSAEKDVVRQIIRANVDALRGCWDSLGGIRGKVSVSFTIADDGAVKASKARAGEVDHDAAAACIRDEIAGWIFVSGAPGKVSLDIDFAVE
jgi:hypothetical protein